MKISRAWLETYFDSPLPTDQELYDALTFHVFEVDGIEKVEDDSVFDVKVTANRGHDCLSHHGIAKELSAILKLPLKRDSFASLPGLHLGTGNGSVQAPIDVSIEEPSLCRRYIAARMTGVTVGPSPEWLRFALESMGQKSVNNVVDATNYVMFDVGQPLHAFDANRLAKRGDRFAIAVRKARPGEQLHALDGKEYALNDSILAIVDGSADVPIAIAGVKGGMPAGIDESTTDIILESANFDGVSVRKASQTLKLRTDASARFEQVISPELAAYGMRDVVDLILRLAGGELAGYVDEYPSPIARQEVSVSAKHASDMLGMPVSEAGVADVFARLGFDFKQEGDSFSVTPPVERLDLTIPEDLVEEIGRIIGYDNVPATPLVAPERAPSVNERFYWSEKIREYLVAQGFSEVLTSVFADTGERVVLNKADGTRPYLRTSIANGLRDALERNIRIKDLVGIKQVKLFEIGTIWKDGKEALDVQIAVEKMKKQKTEDEYRAELDAFIKSIRAADRYDDLPLSATDKYQPFSKYPFVVRDIAMWTPAGTDAQSVRAMIAKEAGALLVRSELFDRFEKNGKVSIAFRLVFQSFDKTLTDDEVNTIMQAVSSMLAGQGFEIR